MVDTTLWGTILFVSIVSMTPGPNNLLLAASGANYGFYRTLPHMCGVIVSFAIMVVASGFGTAIGKLMQSQGAFRVFNLVMASLLVACVIPIAFG